jgi:hypothetical protein
VHPAGPFPIELAAFETVEGFEGASAEATPRRLSVGSVHADSAAIHINGAAVFEMTVCHLPIDFVEIPGRYACAAVDSCGAWINPQPARRSRRSIGTCRSGFLRRVANNLASAAVKEVKEFGELDGSTMLLMRYLN